MPCDSNRKDKTIEPIKTSVLAYVGGRTGREQRISRTVKILYEVIMTHIHHCPFVQTHRVYSTRVNTKVSYRLCIITMC